MKNKFLTFSYLMIFFQFPGVLILVYFFADKLLEGSKHENLKVSDFQWKFDTRTTLPLLFIGSFTLSYLIIYCVCKRTDKARIDREMEIRLRDIRRGRGSLPRCSLSTRGSLSVPAHASRGSLSGSVIRKSSSKLARLGTSQDSHSEASALVH